MSHSASLADYRTALSTPGALRPVLASLLGRLPIAMVGFSVLLYVQYTTGSFAVAGIVAAGMLLGIAIGSVAQGRIIDRFGPTLPILVVTALFTVAITALIVGIEARLDTALLSAVAVMAGLTQPMIASASRALWSTLVPEGPVRNAAYAYEAISMEVFFILGPGFAGLMLALPWPGYGVVVGAAIMVAGSYVFALSPAVRAWRARPRAAVPPPLLGALASPGMRTLAIAALGFGVVIGFVEVAVPATATTAGHPTLGGLMLSVWSLSSVLFGVYYSIRPWPKAMPLRMPVLLAGFGVMVGLLALPTSLAPTSMVLLGCSMVFAGALITPQATTHSTIIDVVTGRGSATEAFGWVITAVMIGVAFGQSMSGLIVEWSGPPASFLTATLCAGVLAALVYARRATVTPSGTPAAQVVQLCAHAELSRTPQHGVDVGIDQLDDFPGACVRP